MQIHKLFSYYSDYACYWQGGWLTDSNCIFLTVLIGVNLVRLAYCLYLLSTLSDCEIVSQ